MYTEPHESHLYHERPNGVVLCDYFKSAAPFGTYLTRQGTDLHHNLFQSSMLNHISTSRMFKGKFIHAYLLLGDLALTLDIQGIPICMQMI